MFYWCIQSYFSSSWCGKNETAIEIIDPFSSSSSPRIICLLPSVPCLIKVPSWLPPPPLLFPPETVPRSQTVAALRFPSPAPTLSRRTYLSLSPLVYQAPEDFHLWLVRNNTVFFCKKYFKYIVLWMFEEKRDKNLWHMQPSVKKVSNLETS